MVAVPQAPDVSTRGCSTGKETHGMMAVTSPVAVRTVLNDSSCADPSKSRKMHETVVLCTPPGRSVDLPGE